MTQQDDDFFYRTVNRFQDVDKKLDNLQSSQNTYGYVTRRTVTVGSGKDFATIQEAITFFKGKQFGKADSIIDVDAGTYSENVAINRLDNGTLFSLTLRGDGRSIVGYSFVSGYALAATWAPGAVYVVGNVVRANAVAGRGKFLVCTVAGTSIGAEPAWGNPGTIQSEGGGGTPTWLIQGYRINPQGIGNFGTGWCELTNAGFTLTVSGVTNPNLPAAGAVAGDICLIRDNTGVMSTRIIQSVAGNVFTFTVASPTVGNPGSSVCVMPNRTITAPSGYVLNMVSAGLNLTGFCILVPTGGIGLFMDYGSIFNCQNCVFWDDAVAGASNYGIIAKNSILDIRNSCVTFAGLQASLATQVGARVNIWFARIVHSYGFAIQAIEPGEIYLSDMILSAVTGAAGACYDSAYSAAIFKAYNCDFYYGQYGVVAATGEVIATSCRFFQCSYGMVVSVQTGVADGSSFCQVTFGIYALSGGTVRAIGTSTLMASVVTPYTPAVSLAPGATGEMTWWT